VQRLLIVDEQPVMRAGIAHAVEATGLALEMVGVGSAPEAITKLRTGTWSAAMIDIGLTEGGGISFLNRLVKTHADVPVLVFTAMPESPYGLRALRAGAAGYVHKSAAPEVLAEALRRVLAGRRYVSPALAEQLADRMVNDSDRAPHELLTDREFEIFRLLALGNTVAEIGESLNISPKTVHVHRANILRKTGLADNRTLTSYAFEHKLIPGRRSEDRTADGDEPVQ
jgi:two-component system, NarL family, invasion response regulator UvrY